MRESQMAKKNYTGKDTRLYKMIAITAMNKA